MPVYRFLHTHLPRKVHFPLARRIFERKILDLACTFRLELIRVHQRIPLHLDLFSMRVRFPPPPPGLAEARSGEAKRRDRQFVIRELRHRERANRSGATSLERPGKPHIRPLAARGVRAAPGFGEHGLWLETEYDGSWSGRRLRAEIHHACAGGELGERPFAHGGEGLAGGLESRVCPERPWWRVPPETLMEPWPRGPQPEAARSISGSPVAGRRQG